MATLNNFTITSPQNQDILIYSNGSWINSNISGFFGILDGRYSANIHNHDGRYMLKADAYTKSQTYPAASLYTRAEIDAMFSGYTPGTGGGGGGLVNSASNVGSGSGVFHANSGGDLQFRSLFSQDLDLLTIAVSGTSIIFTPNTPTWSRLVSDNGQLTTSHVNFANQSLNTTSKPSFSGLTINTGSWSTSGLKLTGAAPSIYFSQDDSVNAFLGINTDTFYLLPDTDSNGSFESPYTLAVGITSNSFTYKGNAIYHAGNKPTWNEIGDKPDVLTAEYQLAAADLNDYQTKLSGFNTISDSSGIGLSGWQHVIHMYHNHENGYAGQIAMSYGTTPTMRIRGSGSSGWGSWMTVWTSANDGSGSGLNADLLDGYHASSFMNVNGDYGENIGLGKYIYLKDYDDGNTASGIKSYVRDGIWRLFKDTNTPADVDIQLNGNFVYHAGRKPTEIDSHGQKVVPSNRNIIASGVFSYGTRAATDNPPYSSNYGESIVWGNGTGGSIELWGGWTSGGWGRLYTRALRNTTDNWSSWYEVYTSREPRMRSVYTNGYHGLADPDGNASNWIRTTVNGIIPYQSGGASSIGTSSWRFTNGYFNNIYATAASVEGTLTLKNNNTNTLVIDKSTNSNYSGITFSSGGKQAWLLYTVNNGTNDLTLQSRNFETDSSYKHTILAIDHTNGGVRFYHDLVSDGDLSVNGVSSLHDVGILTFKDPGTSGAVGLNVHSDNWLRYRFGGTSDIRGIQISNYDTGRIFLCRDGWAEFISDDGLTVKSITNGAGAVIKFSDNVSNNYSQSGSMEYFHSDNAIMPGTSDCFYFKGVSSSQTGFRFEGKMLVNTLEVNVGSWNASGFRLSGVSPSIYFNQTDGPNMFAGVNSGTFFLLNDAGSDGNFDSPYLLEVSFNGGMYHLNREVVTSVINQSISGNKTWTGATNFTGSTTVNNNPLTIHRDSGNEAQLDFRSGTEVARVFWRGSDDNFGFYINSATRLRWTGSNDRWTASGEIWADDHVATSDIRVKDNLERIDNALDKIAKLTGFTYDQTRLKQRKAGIIAQDVEQVLPEAISKDEEGTLSVSPMAILGLLVNAVNELSKEVKELKNG